MWKLTIEDEEGKRTTVPLSRDDYSIGRKEGNTIRLTERNVSREHARIRRENGAGSLYWIEDRESYNGVYVNGLRVAEPQKLEHGDLVQVGDYRVVINDDDALVEEPAADLAATTEHMKSTIPSGHMNRGLQLMERPDRLVMLAGPTPGAEYPLNVERVTIGRAEDATISVNHNSVSRLHCEIHAIGEGRFEVVDKGSSNGVRVNGSDLRRGLIEAGDVIELGDVRLRFVGAGQVFLPGVGDSQQLEALGDRRVGSVPAPRMRGGSASVVPWIVLGTVVAGVALVGLWMYAGQGPAVAQVVGIEAGSVSAVNPEEAALGAAKALCDQGHCDVAHDKLTVSIAPDSPLCKSADFAAIEARWAEGLLAAAEREPDVSRKRSLLNLVATAATAPEGARATAAAKLKALASAALPGPSGIAIVKAPLPTSSPVASVATTAPPATAHPTASATSTSTAVPTASATGRKPAAGSPYERASALVLAQDSGGARVILEPGVMSGKGSADEIRLLKGICKSQGDKVCSNAIKNLYP